MSRRSHKRKGDDEDDDHHLATDDEFDEQEDHKPTKKRRGRTAAKIDTRDDDWLMRELLEQQSPSGRDSLAEDLPPEKERSSSAGSISRIYVENFMCHRKFHIDFNRHLNFITGRNGSGKSAIAAAIQLCLGATAKAAGRGSNLGEVVREGSPGPAIVEVTLVNEGDDAYLPNVYGKRITVRRKIPRSGGASYHLLDEHGHEQANQKTELEKILRSFDIYVDNPCCVLTQEDSKKFIQGKSTDKYEFFLKATGLQSLKEELIDLHNSLQDSEGYLEKQAKKIESAQAAVEKAKKIFDKMVQLDTMEEEINLCVAKTFWFEVKVAENTLTIAQQDLERKQAVAAKAKKDYERASGDDTSQQEAVTALSSEMDELNVQLERVNQECKQRHAQVVESQRKVNTTKQSVQELRRNRQELNQRLQNVQQQIQELRNKALASAKEGEVELVRALARVESEMEALQAKDTDLKQQQREYRRQEQESQSQRQRMQQDITQLQRAIGKLDGDIHGLENSGQNKAAMYNGKFPQLLQQIELKMQSGAFRGHVFGPLGMHVQMREGYEEWSQALERAIGAQVYSFVIDNFDDRALLHKLMQQCGCVSPIVIQTSNRRYDVHSAAPEHVVSMLDAVHIPEDVVFNCLVDQANIERTYFVNDEQEIIRNHVETAGGMDRLKYNAYAFITKNAITVKYVSGNQSSEVSNYKHRGFLAKDLTSYLEVARAEREGKVQELLALQQQYQSFGQGNRYQAEMSRIERDLQQVSTQLRVKSREKKQLDDQMSELDDAKQIDTSNLESEAEDLKQEIVNMQQQEEEKLSSVSVINAELQLRQQAKREIDEESNQLKQKINELVTQIEQISHDMETAKRTVDKLRKQVDASKADVAKAEGVLEKVTADLTKLQEQAQEETRKLVPDWDGSPLPLGRKETKEALDRKAMELRAELAQGKRQAGLQGFTLEIAKERYEKAEATHAGMVTIYETIQTSFDQLERDLNDRKNRLKQTLTATTKKVKHKFDQYIQEKGGTGTVKFNHELKTLELKVQIDAEDANSLANDVRNLSGGERSYVAFSLLQALGHVIESPFRLMDEYDVFLDNVARKLTLDQLQAYAFRPDQMFRQFIVITPHELSSVKSGPNCRIYKMTDPQRHSASGLQQQTLD